MSISNTNSSMGYTANGVQVAFPTTFRFLEDDHLVVKVTPLGGVVSTKALNADYTVAGEDEDAGGTVTFLVAPAANAAVTITRRTPRTQETSFRNNGQSTFSPALHERALDKLTMIAQEDAADIAALQSLGNLVTVTALGAGVNYAGALTPLDPVETSFPLVIVVAGGLNAKYILWHIYATAADDNPLTEPPAVDWVAGPGANQVTIRGISGIKPGINYTMKGLVLF